MAMLTPVDFWLEARKALRQTKNLFWLAELDPLDNPDYMNVFDSAYTWRWMNAAKQTKDEGAQQIHHLKYVLSQYLNELPHTACPAWFTSNHDENSWNGTEYEKYGEMAIPLAVFSATWKGIPLIYSGQELPNQKRLQFFDKEIIEWNGDPSLHDFYKQILNLRKVVPAFKSIKSGIALAIVVFVATLIVGIIAEPVGVPRPVVKTTILIPAAANPVSCSVSCPGVSIK